MKGGGWKGFSPPKIEMKKNNLLLIVCIIFVCGSATNSLAVYGVPMINLAHANKLESIGRYAQAAQERELTVEFYKYLSIPQFEDDMEFFRSIGDEQKAKFCESTIAGFKKSMQECQKRLEENLAKANLTKEDIDRYRILNRKRLLASAKLYPVMHNGQMGVDLKFLERNGKFSEDFEKAAEGRERSARLYEKLTVNYLMKEVAILEKDGKAEIAKKYREDAQKHRQKAKEYYEMAKQHRVKAKALKKFDNTEYLMSALEDEAPNIRLLALEKLARELNYLGLLKASKSSDGVLRQRANETLQKNKRLFKSVGTAALVDALASDDISIRKIAISKLELLANTNLGYVPDADESSRKIAMERWKGWIMAKLKPGLLGIYYRKKNFEGEVLSRVDKRIKFKWREAPAENMPKDEFSIRWVGKINIPHDGVYTLSFKNDDGVKVWFGRTLDTMEQIAVDVSEYGYGGYKTKLNLKKGFYDISIEFFENKKDAHIEFSWDSEYIQKGIVPPKNLFHIKL